MLMLDSCYTTDGVTSSTYVYQADSKYCIVFQGFLSFDFEKENSHPYLYIMLFSVVCKVLIVLSDRIWEQKGRRQQ